MFMHRRVAARTLTIESARGRPWEERLAMHRVTVVTALSELVTLAPAEAGA
jgi:hypothetical protein